MANAWRKLDDLIAKLQSANQATGTHQNGFQQWDDKARWEEIDKYHRAESEKAESAVHAFLAANRGSNVKPPWLARGKLKSGWATYKSYL
jgi:hypothetical protein